VGGSGHQGNPRPLAIALGWQLLSSPWPVGLIGTNGLEHQDLIVGFLAHTGLTLDPEPPTQPTVLR
jgi:hypothetical protein